VTIPTDQPGWRPDPDAPGAQRWWNGTDWTDDRRAGDADAAEPTIDPSPASPARPRNALQKASDVVVDPALAVSNPFAAAALAVGVIGVLFGALGVLPTLGLVVSILGLVRSRRVAREGGAKTGRWQSVVGLCLSAVGLLRLLPVFAALVPGQLLGHA